MTEYSITPTPELIRQWQQEANHNEPMFPQVANQAAQWGADQELEACCDHIRNYQWGFVDRPDGTKMHRAVDLELARRLKPPTLKKLALAILCDCSDRLDGAHENIIRRALEELPND